MELLVVMAIIALLASIVVAGVQHAQTKSRDVRRVEDMNQISKALNLYYTDHNKFPKSATEVVINGSSDALSSALISNNAMPVVPTDPLTPDDTYKYWYQTNSIGTTYTLRFCLETDSIPNYSAGCTNTMRP